VAYVHLYPEEEKLVSDWLLEHDKTCALKRLPTGQPVGGNLGERLVFTVIPTSIGNVTHVECLCGAKLSMPTEDEGVLMGKPEYHDPPAK
jgi:hypothetical protein